MFMEIHILFDCNFVLRYFFFYFLLQQCKERYLKVNFWNQKFSEQAHGTLKNPELKTFKGIHSIYILSYRPFHLKATRTLVSTLFAHSDFLLLLQNSQISSKITCVEQDVEYLY